MDLSEIEKKLAEFNATLKPVQAPAPAPKIQKTKKPAFAGEEVVTLSPAPEPEPTPSEALTPVPCFNQSFKDMVKALKPYFLGANGIDAFLNDLFEQVPTCSAEEILKEAQK